MANLRRIGTLLLALGSNLPGRWGSPHQSLARRVPNWRRQASTSCSHLSYIELGLWEGGVSPRISMPCWSRPAISPRGISLRLVKRTERRAGRRATPPMQPRPLDIDILDYGGRRLNWPCRQRQRGQLVLPHPLLDRRGFVLVPLMEVAPRWTHPVLGSRPRTMLARLGPGAARGVRSVLDFRLSTCENPPR